MSRDTYPAVPCQVGDRDYAWAIGGTWKAPILEFSFTGQPKPAGANVPDRVGTPVCNTGPKSWVWATKAGDVKIKKQS